MPDKTPPRPELVDLLVDRHWAISPTHARDLLEELKSAGLAIAPHDVLDETQRARVEALRVAKNVLSRPTGGLTPATALPTSDIDNLVPLARFVLTGSEYEDDIRIAAAETRAANEGAPVEVTGGHVCQAVPDMPAGEDPGPLGDTIYSRTGEWPTTSPAFGSYDRPS